MSGSVGCGGISGAVQFGEDLPVSLANPDELLLLAAAIRMVALYSGAKGLLDLLASAVSRNIEDQVRIHNPTGILPE